MRETKNQKGKPVIKLILFLLLGTIALVSASQNQDNHDMFLFSFFKDNGEDGLHLAWSSDGMKWESLNNNKSFLAPKVGNDKLMRDPCIIHGPNGRYHMVWTISWHEKGIGYASSPDLLNWSEQKYIPVMEHEPTAKNCWAPEIFFDNASGKYIIFWSTTIPGRFPETEKQAGDNNHRMYYTTTTDFVTFAPTKLFYDKGFNVIDGTLAKENDQYFLFLKDETADPPQKNIRISFGSEPAGTWSEPTAPITGDYWAEGPTVIKKDGYWIVYFDKYRKNTMGAVRSKNLRNWEDISEKVMFPEGTRHGSVLKVNAGTIEKLKNYTQEWQK